MNALRLHASKGLRIRCLGFRNPVESLIDSLKNSFLISIKRRIGDRSLEMPSKINPSWLHC